MLELWWIGKCWKCGKSAKVRKIRTTSEEQLEVELPDSKRAETRISPNPQCGAVNEFLDASMKQEYLESAQV